MRLLSLFLLLLLCASPLQAADTGDVRDQAWWARMNRQLVESIETPIPGVQEEALRLVISLAQDENQQLDLAASLPTLATLYQDSNDPELRRLALLAMMHIRHSTTEVQASTAEVSTRPVVKS
ncbi:MAG: hypothetical protein AAGI71_18940 [Bacteroidota bacterium]